MWRRFSAASAPLQGAAANFRSPFSESGFRFGSFVENKEEVGFEW
jgi:hypothetical protein